VIRWPGQVPAGVVRRGITSIMDLYATALEVARVDMPADHAVDGRNLLPFLKGEAPAPHADHYYYRGKRLLAVRSGAWKLHLWRVKQGKHGKYRHAAVCDPPELYNLENDPGERRNVASGSQDVVARLRRLATEFEEAMEPGKLPPPQWRSVLPRVRRGGKRQG
jgi:arylsulfatase A-like enzyme